MFEVRLFLRKLILLFSKDALMLLKDPISTKYCLKRNHSVQNPEKKWFAQKILTSASVVICDDKKWFTNDVSLRMISGVMAAKNYYIDMNYIHWNIT